MTDLFVYETEFSFMIAVRNVSYAYSFFRKIRTYDNVGLLDLSVGVSSSLGL